MGESFQRMKDFFSLPPESLESSEQLLDKDFFDIQLQFVRHVRGLDPSISLETALAQLTCIHSRFGIGPTPTARPSHPLWQEYVRGLRNAEGDELSEQELLEWTHDFYTKHYDRQLPHVEQSGLRTSEAFGWFWYDYNPESKTIDPHFRRPDSGAVFGLGFVAARKRDLAAMFTDIKEKHPDAVYVTGGSWLLGDKKLVEIVRKFEVFPESFLTPLPPEKGRRRFTGLGTWGQFLDDQLKTKPEMKSIFLERMKNVTLDNLEDAFPTPRVRSLAPIEDFYVLYGIK